MADNKDTKNYQKVQSRSASKQKTKQTTLSEQTIKYLALNPLAVNYIIKQETYANGDNTNIHAEPKYSN